MIRNQFGKRNLSNYDRAKLALLLEPLVAAKAKENQATAGGDKVTEQGKALLENSPKAVEPINTRIEVAKAGFRLTM